MKIWSVAKNDQVEGRKEDKTHNDLYFLVFQEHSIFKIQLVLSQEC